MQVPKVSFNFLFSFSKIVFLIFLGVYTLSVPGLLLQGRIVGVDAALPFEAGLLTLASTVLLAWAGKLSGEFVKKYASNNQEK